MLDLDNLLAESVAARNKERQKKTDKAAEKKQAPKTATQWMNTTEAADHKEQVKKIRERAEDWTTQNCTLMFLNQCCQNCGSEHSHYTGIFIKQKHRRFEATRFTKPTAVIDYADLPREIEVTNQYVPMCNDCCGLTGWPRDGSIPFHINS